MEGGKNMKIAAIVAVVIAAIAGVFALIRRKK